MVFLAVPSGGIDKIMKELIKVKHIMEKKMIYIEGKYSV
jgi:hypothetical protein